MTTQLIIAVETVGISAVAGPVVAAAVAYTSDVVEPVFSIDGDDSKRPLLRDLESLPDVRLSLREHLMRSGLGCAHAQRDAAYVREHGVDAARVKASNAAVMRLFERIAHTRPDFKGLGLENIRVHTPFSTRLEDVPYVIAQYAHLGVYDWRMSAARHLAKEQHRDAMKLLAERYPAYGFTENLGQLTRAHKIIIKQKGLTPDHRIIK